MEELPELPGDVLDVKALQAWALAQQEAVDEVKHHLAQPEVKEALEVRVDGLQHPEDAGPPSSVVAVARLACVLGGSSSLELLQRWKEVDQALNGRSDKSLLHSEVLRLSVELSQARAARIGAYERLEECKRNKQAAQAALAKAMELEEESEDEFETQSLAPSEIAPSEEGDEKGRQKKRGWGGAKKLLGKGLKKIRGKSSQTGSLTPPVATSPVSSFASTRMANRTPSPSRPPTPKELMVQASSDELLHAAEGIQSAAEDLDKETMKCKEYAEAISECMAMHRGGPLRAAQEAIREGVCALEEWADEVQEAAERAELQSLATSVGDAPSSDSDHEWEPEVLSRPSDEAEVQSVDFLDQIARDIKALLQQLSPELLLRHLRKRSNSSGDAGENAIEELSEEELLAELQHLSDINDSLKLSAQSMGTTAIASRLRHFTAALEKKALWLEDMTAAATSARRHYGSYASSCSSSASGSEALGASQQTSYATALAESAELHSPKAAEASTGVEGGSARPSMTEISVNRSRDVPESSEALSPSFGAVRKGFLDDPLREGADAVDAVAEVTLNPFEDTNPFKSGSGSEPTNPFDTRENCEKSNPFTTTTSEEPEGTDNPFGDVESEKGIEGFASPLQKEVKELRSDVTESPASLTEACAYRPALPNKPAYVEALSKSEPNSQPSTPRVTSMTPGAASSVQVWQTSPRQLQSGLAGCLCNVQSPSQKSNELDDELKQVIDAPSLEAALAKSDAALAKGRLGNGDYWNWDWRDHLAEEAHQLLRYSSHSLSDLLTEEDWGYFSYELLLLCRHLLREGPALDQVAALIPICRVRLGINTQLHHHIVELSRPDSEAFSPLDVRYRAALLLRLWSQWETFEYATVADPSKDWTAQWIYMQLRILRGSVIERAMQLHQEGCDDVASCRRCFQAIRELNQIALSGDWGRPQPVDRLSEVSGRRLLTNLCSELDVLAPGESWSFNVVFAARVFSTLWRAATDNEAEDCLSLDAPNAAAALLGTHALLLAQQVWAAAFSSGAQLSAQALVMSESIVSDFSRWLQKTPVDAASCFARQGVSSTRNLPLELVAKRLLTVDLRDQLIQTLRDYRRHYEPVAFAPVLRLWARCYREMRCSELAGRDRRTSEDTELEQDPALSEKATFMRDEESEELLGQFGQWFVWESSSKAAELALHPFDEPPQVPPGEEAWKRLGPKIKNYLQGLTGAVQSLLDELECEKSFYNEAWAAQGLGSRHLSVASSAMVAAVRPRVERLKLGVWPTESSVLEVPPGGGRLIQVLEALDREASRHRESKAIFEPLVDILVPHVTAALTHSLNTLDRDITSHALDGNPDAIFVPLQPPTTIFCEAVVTLWRFIHDALDAPLSLGLPVDIVTSPFMVFLKEVLPRSSERLLRSCEKGEAFRMSSRAAKVAAELKYTNCQIDSDQEEVAGKADDTKRSGRSRRKLFTRADRSFVEETKNVTLEANLLEVNPQVVVTSVQQVMVRLASIGFCCGELAEVQAKLFKMINSGDDDGCPTARHNEARMLICEELPDLQETLLYQGQTLARYLAARLVYHELRSELFEKLYFKTPVMTTGPGSPTPSASFTPGSFTPRSATPGAATNATTGSFLQEGGALLTLKDVVLSRQNSFLSLIEQTPTILLVSFVGELGIELTHAWLYVIVDYLRKQKLDQIYDYLESDQEALSRSIESMMQMTRKRVQTTALGGLTHEDCRNVEKRLEEVQRLSQCLIEEIHSRTADELARYAAKVRGEADGDTFARERSTTPPPGVKPQPRSTSPANARTQSFPHGEVLLSPRCPSPQLPDSPDGGSSKRSAKQLFQQAWKATKRLGKGHKEKHEGHN
ncbi:unnamed protein product [Durusdinium trenchii]|uniref:Uncharacterized protein n=1 Tax=Durusdinium trenchii TaxID=1381693 RepID=A0ABP0KIJ2_9DINO